MIKVIGTDPVVVTHDKEKRIRLEPIYLLRRAPGYSEHSVEILSRTMNTLETKMVASEGDAAGIINESQGPRFGKATFEYTLRARQNFPGGFVVVVIYSPSLLNSSSRYAKPEIVVHDLPSLSAGVATSVDFGSAIPDGRPSTKVFTQIFDNQGREVMTNLTRESWSFYQVMERNQLKAALPRYRDELAGKDHAVTPLVMPRPIIRPEMTLPTAPVTATLSVSAEGLVTAVELSAMDDSNLRHETEEALGGWLFFPQLDQGTPVATKVRVPINF